MMGYMLSVLIGIVAGYGAYRAFLPMNRWLKLRALTRIERKEHLYFAAAAGGYGVPSFHAGGPVRSQLVAGLSMGSTISQICGSSEDKSEPLEETWSNEKVEAWRVIDVTVEEDDDGMWLGFPHPDGPTTDVVTPVRHPIGVELTARCTTGLDIRTRKLFPVCDETPGERCASGYGAGCGFYAFKTREQADTMVRNRILFSPYPLAIAHVLLSGKVIEHEDGYRAEILEVIEVEQPIPMVIPFEQISSLYTQILVWPRPGQGPTTPNPFLVPPIPPTNPFINLGGNS